MNPKLFSVSPPCPVSQVPVLASLLMVTLGSLSGCSNRSQWGGVRAGGEDEKGKPGWRVLPPPGSVARSQPVSSLLCLSLLVKSLQGFSPQGPVCAPQDRGQGALLLWDPLHSQPLSDKPVLWASLCRLPWGQRHPDRLSHTSCPPGGLRGHPPGAQN